MKQKLVLGEKPIIVYKDTKPVEMFINDLVDPILRPDLDKVKNVVLNKDRDWVCVIDGEEGVGKSVLAQQIAKYLDPDFTLDNIVFNANEFIKQIKSPGSKKGRVILLDEAYNSANARASMTEVNRSLVGVATEMRQKNLFVIIVLPSFFDLDRYFALWRCKCLLHVYFNDSEDRRYVIFPKTQKKLLYLRGKKTYNYSKPRSPYPPLVFRHVYTVDEMQYRVKKADAFNIKPITMQQKRWIKQRDAYIVELVNRFKLTHEETGKIVEKYGLEVLSRDIIGLIVKEWYEKQGDA